MKLYIYQGISVLIEFQTLENSSMIWCLFSYISHCLLYKKLWFSNCGWTVNAGSEQMKTYVMLFSGEWAVTCSNWWQDTAVIVAN